LSKEHGFFYASECSASNENLSFHSFSGGIHQGMDFPWSLLCSDDIPLLLKEKTYAATE
jgi:hypothetical protein